jgi:F0F1-type ATP synthase assembly protein I
MKPEQEQEKEKNQKKPQGKWLSSYAKYTGMAFQMGIIIFATTWGGIKIDQLAGFEKPVFTIILSLLGVFAAIYTAVKDFLK